jgi:HK97 family phage major capsid protein
MGDHDHLVTAAEVELELEQLRGEIQQLNVEWRDRQFSDEVRDRWNGLVEKRGQLEKKVRELKTRAEYIASLADDPESSEHVDRRFGERNMALVGGDRERSEALRCNERADFLPERAREHMETMLREEKEPDSQLVRYTQATSDRSYFRAYSKWFNDPEQGPVTWNQKERDAVSRVKEVSRAMNLGTGSAGGFMVPYELDPSIVITASYKDPLRAISRVATTALNENGSSPRPARRARGTRRRPKSAMTARCSPSRRSRARRRRRSSR